VGRLTSLRSDIPPARKDPPGKATDAFPLRPQWLVVAAAVLFNYWFLRSEVLQVSYLTDSSVHQQMVRFAAARLKDGHLPQTSWFPYLGLGSPQFLHYQSLPSTLTGLAGMVIGSNQAFTWSLYLLLSLWPVAVYLGARAFRLDRWTASCAAVLSPFMVSAVGVGFETKAYVWTGFGVWTQLWAMITLPLAWGYCWQATSEGRRYLPAIGFASLTVLLHFETGYLALIPLALLPFLTPSALAQRLKRALVLAAGTLAATAWVTVPLLLSTRWASINEVLRGTPLENGYGAGKVLGWLVSGQLMDAGRFPVLTLLAGIGLVVAVVRWRRDEGARALLILLAMSLVLSFGRTTFGPLVNALPGSTDIFMRRFMSGIQLACLYLAGIGAVAVGTGLLTVLLTLSRRVRMPAESGSTPIGRRRLVWAIATLLAIGVLAPAWTQSIHNDRLNADAIAAQRVADKDQGRTIGPIIERIRTTGAGRVYAGSPNNWGAHFTVGAVPVFKYLEGQDVDEVGYTLRTASLMTDPEYYFDEFNPGDYTLFGVRYVLVPEGKRPPVRATLVMVRGPYALWELPMVGYSFVARGVGVLSANRADIGARSVPFLRSQLPGSNRTLLVDFDGSASDKGALGTNPRSAGPAGKVVSEHVRLDLGSARILVRMKTQGLVVLSASFDPGWTASVDGKPMPTVMVAPALVAVEVPAGAHQVVFRYVGFSFYAPLLIVPIAVFAAALSVDLRKRRQRRLEG
jgi:Bacterial membrane protein YfhO